MNNLTFGDSNMGYYETIAGGAGAGPDWDGRSGVHTHMTNTRITDPGDALSQLLGIPISCDISSADAMPTIICLWNFDLQDDLSSFS